MVKDCPGLRFLFDRGRRVEEAGPYQPRRGIASPHGVLYRLPRTHGTLELIIIEICFDPQVGEPGYQGWRELGLGLQELAEEKYTDHYSRRYGNGAKIVNRLACEMDAV